MRGFTLLECMITLTMLGILCHSASPMFSNLLSKMESETAARQLMQRVQMARATAVNQRNITTLCGSNDGRRCSKNAASQFLLFEDANSNHQHDASEILYSYIRFETRGSVWLRASRGAEYLRFQPEGFALEFGSLVFCPADHRPQFIRAVIINRAGRPYFARDKNNDGILEDADGVNLVC